MTIFIAHSVPLRPRALQHRLRLRGAGHTGILAVTSGLPTERAYHQASDHLIADAGQVFAIWNGISDGCPMDVAAALALKKPVYVEIVSSAPLPTASCLTDGLSMRRSWALFRELPTIEQWWEEQDKEKAPPE